MTGSTADKQALGVHAMGLLALAAIIVVTAVTTGDVVVVLLVAFAAVVAGRAWNAKLQRRIGPEAMDGVERRYGRGANIAAVALALLTVVVAGAIVLG